MQSLRQYRLLRIAAESQANTGRVVNCPNDKRSVFERQSSSESTITTTDSSEWKESNNDPITVGWEGPEDPLNPRNWPITRRCIIFAILWVNVFAVDWASSADSQAGKKIAKAFHVSEEAEALSPSLYTFGLAAGSIFAGPIAETVGRNPIYVVSRCFHVVWLIGAALAPNFAAQCVFRLFAGLSGSIILAIHAASIADIFGPVHRTVAWPVIALASFWGTAFSPLAGAWIVEHGVDWRWTDWIAVILSGSTLILTLFFLPETFSPILLSWRAKHLREATGCDRFKAELDLQKNLGERFKIAVLRAFHMITREPIVVLMGSWIVLEYLVVFGFLQGFTNIFGDTFNFSRGQAGSCFGAIAVGCALWTCAVPIYYKQYKRKVRKLHEHLSGQSEDDLVAAANLPGSDLPDPEYRLWSSILAAPALPISLFWLGWTNYSWISPWSDIGAVTLLGFSWAGIYVTIYQYLLDTYGIYAGSALAMVTCWRYSVSGAINIASRPMYSTLGVQWSTTWLGCLAVLLTPLPLLFYCYGPRLRLKSSFASRYARPESQRERIGRASHWR